jgi:pyruvate dehydrogenase E1 component alpha subunit
MHTTADDPTKYRSEEEVRAWERKDPLTRFSAYLQKKRLLAEGLEGEVDEEIARAVQAFEAMPPADPLTMFDHIYGEMPSDLKAQREELSAREAAPPAPDAKPQAPMPMRGQRTTRR